MPCLPLHLAFRAAISQVFFVEGVEAHRNKTMPVFIRKVHAQLLLIGLFPTLAIILTGPQVFGFILGKEWSVSGQYLQLIAPGYSWPVWHLHLLEHSIFLKGSALIL